MINNTFQYQEKSNISLKKILKQIRTHIIPFTTIVLSILLTIIGWQSFKVNSYRKAGREVLVTAYKIKNDIYTSDKNYFDSFDQRCFGSHILLNDKSAYNNFHSYSNYMNDKINEIEHATSDVITACFTSINSLVDTGSYFSPNTIDKSASAEKIVPSINRLSTALGITRNDINKIYIFNGNHFILGDLEFASSEYFKALERKLNQAGAALSSARNNILNSIQ